MELTPLVSANHTHQLNDTRVGEVRIQRDSLTITMGSEQWDTRKQHSLTMGGKQRDTHKPHSLTMGGKQRDTYKQQFNNGR